MLLIRSKSYLSFLGLLRGMGSFPAELTYAYIKGAVSRPAWKTSAQPQHVAFEARQGENAGLKIKRGKNTDVG
ncbi:hypothetical protein ACFOSS_15905 [Pseudaeromonas sharmana]|uniref:Uncharacterized protein n=1 Tax=Pseudaeromonas sharmana TaxID=328412 RepID=A0ABV8CST8_9GAMM